MINHRIFYQRQTFVWVLSHMVEAYPTNIFSIHYKGGNYIYKDAINLGVDNTPNDEPCVVELYVIEKTSGTYCWPIMHHPQFNTKLIQMNGFPSRRRILRGKAMLACHCRIADNIIRS